MQGRRRARAAGAAALLCAVSCGPPPPDVAAAIRAARAEGPGFSRLVSLSTRLDALGAAGTAWFPDGLTDPGLELDVGESVLLVCYWSDHAPREASVWLLEHGAAHARPGAVECAVRAFARADPQAAARSVGAARVPEAVLAVADRALVHGWLSAGGAGLEDFLRDLGPGLRRQRALAAYVHRNIRRDGPEAAARFAASVPGDDRRYRLDVLRQTALALATSHPERAAAWCDRVCEDGDGVRMLVAQRWAARDGLAAMRWAASTTAAPDRRWALKGAFRGWTRADRAGFARWLAEAAPPGARLPAWLAPVVEAWAATLAAEDPQAALRWAARLEEPDLRESLQVSVVRYWREQDAEAAEAWLLASDLPEAARARARAKSPRRGAGARRPPGEE